MSKPHGKRSRSSILFVGPSAFTGILSFFAACSFCLLVEVSPVRALIAGVVVAVISAIAHAWVIRNVYMFRGD